MKFKFLKSFSWLNKLLTGSYATTEVMISGLSEAPPPFPLTKGFVGCLKLCFSNQNKNTSLLI